MSDEAFSSGAADMMACKRVRISTNGKVRSYVTNALDTLLVSRVCLTLWLCRALTDTLFVLTAWTGPAERTGPGSEQGGHGGRDHEAAPERSPPEYPDWPGGFGRSAGGCDHHLAVLEAARSLETGVSHLFTVLRYRL